jgi:predicted nucleic-acid-binding protein
MAYLDTNVVVRLLLGDDLAQAQAAEKLVASEKCNVTPSVLMETEWVLRSGYGLNSKTIAESFKSFLMLENISASEPTITQRVLDAFGSGLDFADALHAIQCKEGEKFATFDKQLAINASKIGFSGVRLLKN